MQLHGLKNQCQPSNGKLIHLVRWCQTTETSVNSSLFHSAVQMLPRFWQNHFELWIESMSSPRSFKQLVPVHMQPKIDILNKTAEPSMHFQFISHFSLIKAKLFEKNERMILSGYYYIDYREELCKALYSVSYPHIFGNRFFNVRCHEKL